MSTSVRVKWHGDAVVAKISGEMRKRVVQSTVFLRGRVANNISIPVTRVGRVVTERSLPGEFPRKDTSLLLNTLMSGVKETRKNVFDGFVGTPLKYGVRLELKMNRSFLVRTLRENSRLIVNNLTRPFK